MNSHQRRRDRRQWRYCSRQARHEVTRSWTWDQAVAEYMRRFDWCVEQWGDRVDRCGWRERGMGKRWEFDCPKKATLFRLRWS